MRCEARVAIARACLAIGAPVLAAATTASPAAATPPGPPLATASSACLTDLPLVATVSSRYSASYRRVLLVRVTGRVPVVRHLRVSLYTFSGDLLGRGTRRALSGSGIVRLRLRFRLQPGEYTLYSEGEPNADPSCGPKHRSRVVRFRGCRTELPVSFPEPPEGTAADYGDYLSFRLRSTGPLIRRVRIDILDPAGNRVGETRLAALFGTVGVDVPLGSHLAPGEYTIAVSGAISSEPASCWTPSAEQALTFT